MTDATTDLGFIDQLIRAKQALDELPAVKEDLSTAHANLDRAYGTIGSLKSDLELREMELDELRATLAAKEVALAAATFREQAAQDKLNLLRGVLGSGDGNNAVAQPTITHEVVMPMVGQSDLDPTVPDHNIGQSTNTESANAPYIPAPEQESVGISESGRAATGQSDQSPTAFGPQVNSSPSAGSENAESTNVAHTPDTGSEIPATTSTGESAVDPTLNQPTAPSQDGDTPSSETARSTTVSQPSNATAETCNHHHHFWSKPETTTWVEWSAAGNEIAPWLNPDGTHKHPNLDPRAAE